MKILFKFGLSLLMFFLFSCVQSNQKNSYSGNVKKIVYIIKDYPDEKIILARSRTVMEDGSTTAVQIVKPGTKFIAYNMRQKPMLETGAAFIEFQVKIRVNGIDYDIPARFVSSNIKEIDINTYLEFE